MKRIFLFLLVSLASVSAALAYSERDGVLNANPSLDKADYVGFSKGCRKEVNNEVE